MRLLRGREAGGRDYYTCMHAIQKQGNRISPLSGFAPLLPRIKQGTNAVINITTGGSPYMTVEERGRTGSLNLNQKWPLSIWAR